MTCRSLRGERGLKRLQPVGRRNRVRRSLRGERGLKLRPGLGVCLECRSLPSRGAWIETYIEVRITR